MSLVVWLPLNGDLTNQGIIGSSVTTSGSYSFTSGKLGRCVTSSSSGYCQVAMGGKVAELTASNQFSIGAWIKTTGASAYLINIGNADNTSVGNTRGLWLSENGYTQWAFTGTGVPNTAIPINDGVWRHIFCTVDGSTVNTYINGILHSTITATITAQVTGHEYASVHPTSTTFINDFRVYDTCLSAKEVKEISKGLVVHYPLNQFGTVKGKNLLNASMLTTADANTPNLMTDVINDCNNYGFTAEGWHFATSSTGVANSNGVSVRLPRSYSGLKPGDTVTFSIDIKGTIGTGTPVVQYWSTTPTGNYFWARREFGDVFTDVKKDEWQRYSMTVTLNDLYSGDDWDYFNVGGGYNADLYVRNAKVEYGSYATPYTQSPADNPVFYDNIEYDTSGLGNHGSRANVLAYSTNSPRNDGCYYFENKHYITGVSPWGGSVDLEQFTISMWLKQDSSNNGPYSTFFNSWGYGQSGLWLGMNIENCGLWGFRGGVSPNYARSGEGNIATDTWYHVSYVFNQGSVTWYLNGVKKATTKYNGTTITIGSTFNIGDAYSGSSWNTNFAGNISDFRWYVTVLSDIDIRALYNAPISITTDGTLMTQGEFKEV